MSVIAIARKLMKHYKLAII